MSNIIYIGRPWFIKIIGIFSKPYVRESQIINKKSATTYSDDLFSAEDNRRCDLKASLIEKKLKEILFNYSKFDFFDFIKDEKIKNYFVNNDVLDDITKIYQSYNLFLKVQEKNQIKGKTYFYPDNFFSLRVFSALEKKGYFAKSFLIHPIAKIHLRLFNGLKFLYFFSKFLIDIEKYIFLGLFNKGQKDLTIKNIAILYDGLFQSINAQDRIFELFDATNTLFVDIDYDRKPKWVSLIGKSYQSIALGHLPKQFSFLDSFSIYRKYVIDYRIKTLMIMILYPYLAKSISRGLNDLFLWNLFYKKYKAESVFSMMTKDRLIASIVHKKYNTKNVFLYFSNTDPIVKEAIQENLSTCLDYNHMNYDLLISSPPSIRWLKSQDSNILNYEYLGPFFSQKKSAKKNTSILSQTKTRKIITFFDVSVGFKGVLSYKNYEKFLKGIELITQTYGEFLIIYKAKKNTPFFIENQKIKKLLEGSNFILANQHNLNASYLINMSEIVVTAPLSSIFYECIESETKVIAFDPEGQYQNHDTIINKYPDFYVTNEQDLSKSVSKTVNLGKFKNYKNLFENDLNQFLDNTVCKDSFSDRLQRNLKEKHG